MKVTIVGAGGYVFPIRLCVDIVAMPALRDCQICLYDIHEGRLHATQARVERMIQMHNLPTHVPQRQLSKFFEAPNQGQPLRLLWLAIGKQDFLLRGNQQFDKLLSEKNVPHQYTETEGAHAWPVWRRYLAEVAPRLFVP